MALGIVGLLISAFRSLAVITMAEEHISWIPRESWTQRLMLSLGVIGLFIMGLFPQSIQFFLANLPLMFDHLGR